MKEWWEQSRCHSPLISRENRDSTCHKISLKSATSSCLPCINLQWLQYWNLSHHRTVWLWQKREKPIARLSQRHDTTSNSFLCYLLPDRMTVTLSVGCEIQNLSKQLVHAQINFVNTSCLDSTRRPSCKQLYVSHWPFLTLQTTKTSKCATSVFLQICTSLDSIH